MIGKITVSTPNPPCAYCGGMAGYHNDSCHNRIPSKTKRAVAEKPKVRAYPSGHVRSIADQVAAGAVVPRRKK